MKLPTLGILDNLAATKKTGRKKTFNFERIMSIFRLL